MSMPIAAPVQSATRSDAKSATAPDIMLFDSLEAAEPSWRALEEIGTYTPYQRFDWIKAYWAAFKPASDIQILVVMNSGRPIALFPFHIVKRLGLRVAQIIGMPISNGDAPVFDAGSRHFLTPDALGAAFRRLPADLVNFHCVSPQIGGSDNPLLVFDHTPAPDNFYANELVPGDVPYIEQSLPHKRRTNIKRSRRRLVEGFGEVHLKAAQSPEEVRALLALFLDQRGKRFVEMGVENIFAREDFRTFFETLAIDGLAQERPALRIHALYAGDRVVATSVGAYGPTQYSQYINSTDYGDASRFSLMGVTLSLLVDELRHDGITSLDMGLGDFDYKLDWTHKTTVYDIVIPNSAAGRIGGPALRAMRSVKRTIKQTPQLWHAARAVQAFKLRMGGAR